MPRCLPARRPRVALSLVLAVVALGVACGGERVPLYSATPFAADPEAPGPFSGALVVTNFGDDTLSLLDPNTGRTLWRIPTGLIPVEPEGPHHVAVDPAGQFLYVNLAKPPGTGTGPHGAHGTGEIPGFLLKLRVQDGSLVSYALLQRSPGDNLITPDGRTLFVSHFELPRWTRAAANGDIRKGDATIAFVDTETMTVKFVPACPAPHGMALGRDGRTLVAACAPDEIALLDTGDPTRPARRFTLPDASEKGFCRSCPYAAALAPDGKIWVTSLGESLGTQHGRGRIDIFDLATLSFDPALTVHLSGSGLFPDFVARGTGATPAFTAYVPEQGQETGDWLRIYDLVPGWPPAPAGAINLGTKGCTAAHAVRVEPGGKRAFVVCEGNHKDAGSVLFVDLETKTVTGTTTVGVFPDDIDLIPSAGKIP